MTIPPPIPTRAPKPPAAMARTKATRSSIKAPAMVAGGRDVLDVRRSRLRPGMIRPLVLDDLPEALTPLTFVIPGQLVAEAVARRRGLDPDAPAGLSKVTLTT